MQPDYMESDSDSDSDTGLEDDDVAFYDEDDHSDIVDTRTQQRSDVVTSLQHDDSEDDILYDDELEVMSLSESDPDEEAVHTFGIGLVSPSGVKWSNTKTASGREHRANVFIGRRGFIPGLRPAQEKEAFLAVFHDLVETAIAYTNKSGKRWASSSGAPHRWRNVDNDEMLAFIGKFGKTDFLDAI
jgi:hypothetical protein